MCVHFDTFVTIFLALSLFKPMKFIMIKLKGRYNQKRDKTIESRDKKVIKREKKKWKSEDTFITT